LLDEPFSGLDPINTEVLRETLVQRQQQGRTIIFSSHRLEQVEELCDHVAIIHRGKLLRTGPLSEVKRSTGRRFVELAFNVVGNGAHEGNGHRADFERFLSALGPYKVAVAEPRRDGMRLELLDGVNSDEVLQAAIQSGPGSIKRFELVEPTLQEIFIEAVGAADPEAVERYGHEMHRFGPKVLTEG
jgi:ABC-2 type transport system ATP-binding protein